MCKTSSFVESGSETSFEEEAGALSPTTKPRISPKPRSLCSTAQSCSKCVKHGGVAAWPGTSERFR